MADNKRTKDAKQLFNDDKQVDFLTLVFGEVWDSDREELLSEYIEENMREEWYGIVKKEAQQAGFPKNAEVGYIDFFITFYDTADAHEWALKALDRNLIDISDKERFKESIETFFATGIDIQLKAESLGNEVKYNVVFRQTPQEWAELHVSPEMMVEALNGQWNPKTTGSAIQKGVIEEGLEGDRLVDSVTQALNDAKFPSDVTIIDYHDFETEAYIDSNLETLIYGAYGGEDLDGDQTITKKELHDTQFKGVIPGFDVNFRSELAKGSEEHMAEFAKMILSAKPDAFSYNVRLLVPYEEWIEKSNPSLLDDRLTNAGLGGHVGKDWDNDFIGSVVQENDSVVADINEKFQDMLSEQNFPEQANVDNVPYRLVAKSRMEYSEWANLIRLENPDRFEDLSTEELEAEFTKYIDSEEYVKDIQNNIDFVEIDVIPEVSAEDWASEHLQEFEMP